MIDVPPEQYEIGSIEASPWQLWFNGSRTKEGTDECPGTTPYLDWHRTGQ